MDILLEKVKEKGVIKIINDNLKYFNHLEKNYKILHKIKFLYVLEQIDNNFKFLKGNTLLKYLLIDKGYLKISYKESQTISMNDILNNVFIDRELEDINDDFYDLIFLRRFRDRELGDNFYDLIFLRRFIMRRARYRPRFFLYTNGDFFPGRIHYSRYFNKLSPPLRKIEEELDQKRQKFIKENYFRDYAKEHKDLLKIRLKNKMISMKNKKKNNARKKQKDLLKYKKLNNKRRK